MLRAGLVLLAWAATGPVAHAGSLAQRLCDHAAPRTAAEQQRLLNFAGLALRELRQAGPVAALVSRSGLDLSAVGQRYSHAGLSLAASPNGAWSVRQLYFACDEGRPRLFDQGMAGFVAGTEDASRGFLSLVLLPDEAAQALARAALDEPRALRVLAGTYSANAYAWSLRYQNCNQWVAELMAVAWGDLADGEDLRARAQAWLADARYRPTDLQVGSHWRMAAAGFVPWLRFDDHPEDDVFALRFRLSMPASLEAFAQAHWTGVRRIELCHRGGRAVLRRQGEPLDADCQAQPGDEVVDLD